MCDIADNPWIPWDVHIRSSCHPTVSELCYDSIAMKANRKSDIFTFLRANRDTIFSYGVKRIGLFGSFVRNSQTDSSDIDVLVEFEQDKQNYRNFIHLAYFLEDNLKRKVDLLTMDSLSPHIGPTILQEVEYVSL